MLKIENVEVVGWEHAIRGMRNPMNSWDKSDSEFVPGMLEDEQTYSPGHFEIGPNDQRLMMTLRNAGTDHRKFMRMIVVYLDITAPLYWWKEFDTYKVGTVANSCSTMHKIHAKEFDISDFSGDHLINDWYDLDYCDCVITSEPDSNGQGPAYYFDPSSLLEVIVDMLNKARELYLQTKDKTYWWQMIQLLPSSYNQKRTVMLNYEVLANIYKSRKNHKLDEWHTLCDWMETLPYSELITGEPFGWKPEDQGRVLNYILQNDPRRDAMNVAVRIFHPYPNIIDYVAVDYDDDDPKFGTAWYSFDMTKVTVIEALDTIKKAIAKMTENGLALGA